MKKIATAMIFGLILFCFSASCTTTGDIEDVAEAIEEVEEEEIEEIVDKID